jgi:GT2 family glycosyltransferase
VRVDRSAAVTNACERARAALQRGDTRSALRHYLYAQRLAPSDSEITLATGAAYLSLHDSCAVEAFKLVAHRDDVREAWLGLAAARHSLSHHEEALRALRVSLSCHGHLRDAANEHLHDAIATQHGDAGWCALSADGTLHVTFLIATGRMHRLTISLDDGVPLLIRPSRTKNGDGHRRALFHLPKAWRMAGLISVCLDGRHLLGSPLQASVIGRLEGFVSAIDGDLYGWAWFPRDPHCVPAITISDAKGKALRITLREPAPKVPHVKPFARPRLLRVSATAIRSMSGPIAVQDDAGRNLYGSPLDPLAERRSAAGAAELVRRRFPAGAIVTTGAVDLGLAAVPAEIVGTHSGPKRVTRASRIDVVIPAYRGHEQTLACIASVLSSLPRNARCVVVDDASPEAELVDALQELAGRGHIVLHRHATNKGFPASANAGIRLAGNRDVILLNSDTLVPKSWIERLADAAYAAPDIGSATPFSNDASVFSYPREAGCNDMLDEAATLDLDRLARCANGKAVIEVPTAHGFCVYLRRDCLKQVGLFREDLFAQGYGEENDFCLRARHLGWRHVAVPGLFVTHAGSGSFGDAQAHLLARNLTIVNRLHPGYDKVVAQFRAADPLAPARFRLDAVRWRQRRSRKGAVVLLTHGREGGVKRRVAERCREIVAEGLRPIVLVPGSDSQDRRRCRLLDGLDDGFPNLRFDVSKGLAELVRFLRGDHPVRVELHHFIGHGPALLGIAHALDVPYDLVVHDYAWVCPRITFVGVDKRYCGEPGGDACEACYADIGGSIDEDISPARLQLRSRSIFAGARHVVVPSQDVAARILRYFPRAVCVVRPWEDDRMLSPRTDNPIGVRMRVVVVGGISIDKGYEYLLACARHVAHQQLALEFVIVGHTCDDARLLDTGVVHITGPYEESEVLELIRAQDAQLGFLPALWPETWSFTLTQIWQAGLDAIAFDIGAPAARIRATGRGTLLPMGLPPASACRALLTYQNGIGSAEAAPAQVVA